MRFQIGEIVLHSLSGLYYICENKKHQKWMSYNSFYVKASSPPSMEYFKKYK